MNGEVFRVRVDRSLLKQAGKVCADIGTTPQEIVRILFAQLVKLRKVPFPLNADAETVPDKLVDIERRNRIWRELDDAEGW
jgi:antitoxin component of RelBE/YafQ-DinJ toxin-antitoxin module